MGCPGLLFAPTCFCPCIVWAAQKGRVWSGLNMRFMHLYAYKFSRPLQNTDLCTLRSQSVIPNQNSVAGFKPKGKHKHPKQRKQARDRQADLFQVIANNYMVLWSHVAAIPQQQGQWGPKGVCRPSSRNTYTSLFFSDSLSGSACLAFIIDCTWAKGKGKEPFESLFAFTLMSWHSSGVFVLCTP